MKWLWQYFIGYNQLVGGGSNQLRVVLALLSVFVWIYQKVILSIIRK
ncbi:MAG: hypothetical protein PHG67_02145 [Bacteroidales bacterium]|nr:hypothetical protein [Bacteroidales bacterium]